MSQTNGSKTSAILSLKREHPEWKPRQIAAELSGRGIAVKPQSVSAILTSNRSKWLTEVLNGNGHSEGVETKSAENHRVQEQKQRPPIGDAVELIGLAKQFIADCDGVENAQAALNGAIELFDLHAGQPD